MPLLHFTSLNKQIKSQQQPNKGLLLLQFQDFRDGIRVKCRILFVCLAEMAFLLSLQRSRLNQVKLDLLGWGRREGSPTTCCSPEWQRQVIEKQRLEWDGTQCFWDLGVHDWLFFSSGILFDGFGLEGPNCILLLIQGESDILSLFFQPLSCSIQGFSSSASLTFWAR